MKIKRLNFILLIAVFLFVYCNSNNSDFTAEQIINFDHLNHLTETITLNGEPCDIIHIYSEYPDYQWIDAAEEGIACVDDVARAAVVYLKYYETTGIDSILVKAKRLINFI